MRRRQSSGSTTTAVQPRPAQRVADELMAEDERKPRPGMIAFDDMQVGSAQTHLAHVDPNLAPDSPRLARAARRESVDPGQDQGRPAHRRIRAPAPAISASTSARVAMEVSPGVVIAKAPWAAPYSSAMSGARPAR